MATIDMNSDLGENEAERVVSDDAAMLQLVTSANVSCGFHAGTPEGIRRTLQDALSQSVVIGAHPGYRDQEGFGRREVDISDADLQTHVEYPLGALAALASGVGGHLSYVKPHGALYNRIARDERHARVVIDAVKAFDPSLVMLGLAGSVAIDVAERVGLRAAAEAFADRAYTPDGHLVDRREPGAVLHDPQVVASRMVRLATEGVIEAIDGSDVGIRAESICVHGDSPAAVAMAEATRSALEAAGVSIKPFTVSA